MTLSKKWRGQIHESWHVKHRVFYGVKGFQAHDLSHKIIDIIASFCDAAEKTFVSMLRQQKCLCGSWRRPMLQKK